GSATIDRAGPAPVVERELLVRREGSFAVHEDSAGSLRELAFASGARASPGRRRILRRRNVPEVNLEIAARPLDLEPHRHGRQPRPYRHEPGGDLGERLGPLVLRFPEAGDGADVRAADPCGTPIGVATGRLQRLLAEILVHGVVAPEAVEDVPRPRTSLTLRQVVCQRGDLGERIDRVGAQVGRHVAAPGALAEDVARDRLELVDAGILPLVPQLHLLTPAVKLAPALEAIGREPAAVDAALHLGAIGPGEEAADQPDRL